MGGRRPGPTCATTAERRDGGTLCLQPSPLPGPAGVHPASAGKERRVLTFDSLWDGYPNDKPYVDKNGDVPKGYENQCAIKLSVALDAAGVDLSGFRGAYVVVKGKRAAIRAEELAQWLKKQRIDGLPPAPANVTGKDWQKKIAGKKGIVFFANYWARSGETRAPSGDHIDLWNGSRLTASGLQGAVVTFLRFGVGIDSGPGFSSLDNASSILFWEAP